MHLAEPKQGGQHGGSPADSDGHAASRSENRHGPDL